MIHLVIFRTGKCRLRQILKEKKITQRELADRINMPVNQISDYVNDRRKPTYETAFNLAKGLKVPMEELFSWVEVSNE